MDQLYYKIRLSANFDAPLCEMFNRGPSCCFSVWRQIEFTQLSITKVTLEHIDRQV